MDAGIKEKLTFRAGAYVATQAFVTVVKNVCNHLIMLHLLGLAFKIEFLWKQI